MVVYIARVAERATRELSSVSLQGPTTEVETTFKGLVFVDGDVELFESPGAILRDATPEALARCQQIQLMVRSAELNICVTFRCRPTEFGAVNLTVTSAVVARSDDVATVAGAVAMAIRRGFRRKMGIVEHSDNLVSGQVGTRAFHGYPFEQVAPLTIGCATGAMFAFTVSTFFPDAHLSPAIFSATAVVPTIAYPLWLRYTVPRVELAAEGKTRLRRTITRSLLGLAGLALTAAVQMLTGK